MRNWAISSYMGPSNLFTEQPVTSPMLEKRINTLEKRNPISGPNPPAPAGPNKWIKCRTSKSIVINCDPRNRDQDTLWPVAAHIRTPDGNHHEPRHAKQSMLETQEAQGLLARSTLTLVSTLTHVSGLSSLIPTQPSSIMGHYPSRAIMTLVTAKRIPTPSTDHELMQCCSHNPHTSMITSRGLAKQPCSSSIPISNWQH